MGSKLNLSIHVPVILGQLGLVGDRSALGRARPKVMATIQGRGGGDSGSAHLGRHVMRKNTSKLIG